MKKLLDQSLRPLIIYAFTVLVISIPVYFLTIDWIWENELDKHHYAIREKLEKRLTHLSLPDTAVDNMISVLDKVQPGFSFSEAISPRADSLYTLIRFDSFMNDREQFRCLSTDIQVNEKRYRVLIETNMEEIDETILAIAAVTVFFIMLLLAGFIYLNRRTAQRIWQPFYDTLSRLQTFRLESGETLPLPASNVTEFAELNAGLETLMQGSLASYRQQKEFTENASHELQTPLAIVKSRLDLLLQSQSLDAQQMQIVEQVYQAINRVSRINKNLLLLARIEHAQFEENQQLALDQIVAVVASQFSDRFEDNTLHYTERITPLTVRANPVLAEILVTNLLVNAVRYTPAGGEIAVHAGEGTLTITNSGPGALQAQNLFRRFAQASEGHVGSGLGLAIAREICERYGWQIGYDFNGGMHRFSVRF